MLTPCVFLVKLSPGNMVLVHPVNNGGETPFLPCTYGCAITIRRAQGASLPMGCLYFDHCYPPERGYGYVGASRFKSADCFFLYGKLRRTDWLPVGGDESTEQAKRSDSSMSDDSDDEDAREFEAAYVAEDDGYDREILDAIRSGQAAGGDSDDCSISQGVGCRVQFQ